MSFFFFIMGGVPTFITHYPMDELNVYDSAVLNILRKLSKKNSNGESI